MQRNVIAGLRRIDWSNPNRQNEFVQALLSAAGALGVEADYPEVCALSGCAFRASFSMQGWNHGNYHVVHTPPILDHAFRMMGLGLEQRVRGDFGEDRRCIMESIDRGVPVITLEGVVNCADACVIAGYDDGGDVLLGWSAFMDIAEDHAEPHDATGYFRKSNWHGDGFARGSLGRILIITDHAPRPSAGQALEATLALAARLIAEPCLVAGQHNGLAAHRAFAAALRTTAWDDAAEPYLNVMCNHKQYLDRQYAAGYLRLAGRSDLADLYTRMADIAGEMGRLIPQDFSAEALFHDRRRLEPYCRALEQVADLEEPALPLLRA